MKNKQKLTVKQVKKVFREKTLSGRFWNRKPIYNPFTKKVTIKMEEGEKLVFDMRTQMGSRKDLDDEGCSIPNDFDFVIGPSKEDGELTILRTN